jgi:LPS O-antigen subunit length determinant protein (WzzB/FepE family)
MEKVVPILTMEKWLPVFWILGIAIVFIAVLMIVDYLKTRGKKGSDKRD